MSADGLVSGDLVNSRLRKSRVRLPAVPLSDNNLGQVVHTHVPLSASSTKCHRSWCGIAPAAGKVTVGQASDWPGVINSPIRAHGLQ